MKELKLFGTRIKELRMIRKLTQEQLAAKAGISAKYMSRIEIGQHFPSLDILTKLTSALNVELKDFFEFSHEAKNIRELKKGLNELLNEADEEKLKLVFKILRAIVR
ncbi:MAG: two component response regulator [Candidatus Scalindua rubra]|uniref:Two component response regulator n=1 Tax=Candidatus Scalindua rubra TaxID=1872076 RepID=A0A1E3X9J7_9BACT|nr:MAG: two component response regulator [Candidatus Scalindua rubra]